LSHLPRLTGRGQVVLGADLNFSESDWGQFAPSSPIALEIYYSYQLTIGPKAMATLMSARRYS
jgi:hypothetical protein